LALLIAVRGLISAWPGCVPEPRLKDGDTIFHTSPCSQSLAIQRATASPYSHVGLIAYRDGRPFNV